MGKRGPTPKPTKLKLLEGNPGKRRINRNEPEPKLPASVPKPPEFLMPEAAVEWRRVAPELHSLGLLSVLDLVPLAAYCQSYAHWLVAELWIAEHGSTVVLRDKDGRVKSIIQAPQVVIAGKALDRLRGFAAHFGMTPGSRSGVVARKPDSPEGKGKGFLDAS